MAAQTILEADGSIDYSKQSDQWLKERSQGYAETIRATRTPSKEDMLAYLAIGQEIHKREVNR